MWLLFGYFVCVMCQTKKKKKNEWILYIEVYNLIISKWGTLKATVRNFPVRLNIIHNILLIRASSQVGQKTAKNHRLCFYMPASAPKDEVNQQINQQALLQRTISRKGFSSQ